MSHLKRTTRIHAPLEKVYALVHDPKHWSEWYVGISDEKDLDALGARGEHRHLMVGTPFPLTQRVLDDHLGPSEAHWRAKASGPPQWVDVSGPCPLLMLAGEHDWTLRTDGDDTEVTVVMDYMVPSEFLEQATDRPVIERMEAECVERSLDNLRRLCETFH